MKRELVRRTLLKALLGLLVFALQASNASASWRIEPSPYPEGKELVSVSCTSGRSCIAVGDTGVGGALPLAEFWNGSRWELLRTPVPPAANGTVRFYAVSCTSPERCVAVGAVEASKPLIESWNGRRWAVESAPQGAGLLWSVSCTSASGCTAVGVVRREAPSGGGLSEPTAVRWNGRSWKLESVPPPPGGAYAGERCELQECKLTAVSCATATSCEALGEYGADEGELFAQWNGSGWAVQLLTPSPSLAQLSCFRGVQCLAVGSNGSFETFAGSWSGGEWSEIRSGIPPKGALGGISCTSGGACTVVGGRFAGSSTIEGLEVPFAARWNGSTWSAEGVQAPRSVSTDLYGVSCIAAEECTAVGAYNLVESDRSSSVLIERETPAKALARRGL